MEAKTLIGLPIFILLLLNSTVGISQPQVVLLSNESERLRFEEGDRFKIRISGEKKSYEDVLVSAWEFGMIGMKDSIRFADITHIHGGGRSTFLSRMGGGILIAGLGYFLIDQVNEGLLTGNDFSFEERVWKPSLVLVLTGGILKLTRKRWYTPGVGRLKLITAQPESPFYRSVDF